MPAIISGTFTDYFCESLKLDISNFQFYFQISLKSVNLRLSNYYFLWTLIYRKNS